MKMVRRKYKWKYGFLFYILLFSVFTKSLPIQKSITSVPNIINSETSYSSVLQNELPESKGVLIASIEDVTVVQEVSSEKNETEKVYITNCTENNDASANRTAVRNLQRQILRPGQVVRQYTVEITVDGNIFHGRSVMDVRISSDGDDPLQFYAEDLVINRVLVGIVSVDSAVETDFSLDDGILEIDPDPKRSSYVVILEYDGNINNDGTGIFESTFSGQRYLGMNLYPIHARRVFPCNDELSELSTVSFTFNGLEFSYIGSNTLPEENTRNTFRALNSPLHLWGMIAHNFSAVMSSPSLNVQLIGRTGLINNQADQAGIAIQDFFNFLNQWTGKPYFEIIVNQDTVLSIIAVPENSVEWYALSKVLIWEPYVYMERDHHSKKQLSVGLVEIAESLARQWFGYVIYPEKWNHQWVINGLGSYAAYRAIDNFPNDLDYNTLFTTEIIQESLLRDAYGYILPIEPQDDIDFEAAPVREHINGIIKYKSPALFRMFRLVLGDVDYVELATKAIFSRWSLEPLSSSDLIDALNDVWRTEPNKLVDDIEEYLEPWITTRGYPFITVGLQSNGIWVRQEHFNYDQTLQQIATIPLTYTHSSVMDFSQVRPIAMMDELMSMQMEIDEEDFVLFNIQGQGYYRVNYEDELWERIIEALDDPERRREIHPLNRATLVDDALNLARAGILDYDIAFRVVLTMQHETEYAPWKAFIRNMNVLRKRLNALVEEDEDLDPDIYLRMVRRTIGTFESEIGFTPNVNILESSMTSLTRGLVMDHACRANYAPCIAAAMDWFYHPNVSEQVVNPSIPSDIRPAVYCTMVREGDAQVVNALYQRLEIEPSMYERLVILESLACSRDSSFINSLLLELIDPASSYGVEERFRIFKAVAESSYDNARLALNFMIFRTISVRNMLGGHQKLEELIYVLADNAANRDLTTDLSVYIRTVDSELDDSVDVARRYLNFAEENLLLDDRTLEYIYDWINENDAPTMGLSLLLLIISMLLTFINQ